jgi:hypothetical protein
VLRKVILKMPLPVHTLMIKIGGAGGYGTEFIIDSEIMTDNLI